MTREIKFRAWDSKLNRMRHFDLLTADNYVSRLDSDVLQFTGLKDKNGKEIYEGDIVLYPDTYTDSVDVGVGMMPVAQTQQNSWGEVSFQEGAFGIDCPKGSETLRRGFKSFWWITNEYGFEMSELEVVGNIYENPELLK